MAVRSSPMGSELPRRSRLGFIRPGQVEGAFIALLYVALLALVLLSIIGTFYGRLGASAPISTPLTIWRDIVAAPAAIALAVGIQAILTATQYGARQFAKRDRRWWLLYLAALGISVYYNWQAYWVPLATLAPWYLAGVLIIAGDVLPEFIAVRRE